jgi:hypothetical protein
MMKKTFSLMLNIEEGDGAWKREKHAESTKELNKLVHFKIKVNQRQ